MGIDAERIAPGLERRGRADGGASGPPNFALPLPYLSLKGPSAILHEVDSFCSAMISYKPILLPLSMLSSANYDLFCRDLVGD
jgi:hypothetical protein